MYTFSLRRITFYGFILLLPYLTQYVVTLPTGSLDLPSTSNLTTHEFGHRCISSPGRFRPFLEFDDCMEANDMFLNDHGLGIFTWTTDKDKEQWPGYILLPDDRSSGSCTMAWDIASGKQFQLSIHDFWYSSENLIRLCVGDGNNDGGTSAFGPSRDQKIIASVTRYDPREPAHNNSEAMSENIKTLLDSGEISID